MINSKIIDFVTEGGFTFYLVISDNEIKSVDSRIKITFQDDALDGDFSFNIAGNDYNGKIKFVPYQGFVNSLDNTNFNVPITNNNADYNFLDLRLLKLFGINSFKITF